MVASGATIISKRENYRWNMRWGLNSYWSVSLTDEYNKPTITFKPSNGAATEGTWECKYGMDQSRRWKKAHIYENENGYLIHEIFLEVNWETSNIECKKTNGKFFRCKVSYYVSCIKISTASCKITCCVIYAQRTLTRRAPLTFKKVLQRSKSAGNDGKKSHFSQET